MGDERTMTWIERTIKEQSEQDPEFRAEYEAEAAILALVRARQAANLTQDDVAKALHVSQPYIAQIERGTRPANLMLMVRYAQAVGAKIEVTSRAA
jgi:DNA-binding XRE family transcriptional regulator